MKVFVYEHLTSGAALRPGGESLPTSLLIEGAAMLNAVVADFAAIEKCEVRFMRDSTVDDLAAALPAAVEVGTWEAVRQQFHQLAMWADYALIIAPESEDVLFEKCRAVESVNCQLLGPSSEQVRVLADKLATRRQLAEHGVPVSDTACSLDDERLNPRMPLPAVIKPRCGAGSQNVLLVTRRDLLHASIGDGDALVESFCPGVAASVACLCGPNGTYSLPAMLQHLSDDGRFKYLGGELLLAGSLTQRAEELAIRAVTAFPDLRGYVGVDLVLGEASDGSQDCVIELNPRLTTSYVGLRTVSSQNLALAMTKISQGEEVELSFREEPLSFSCDGTVSSTSKQFDSIE